MARTRARIDGVKTTHDSLPWVYRAPVSTRCFAARGLLVGLLGTAALFPVGGYSQSLDQAVSGQLETLTEGFDDVNCLRLLGNERAVDILVGGLQKICTRGGPAGGLPPSSGGGAGTPTSLPSIVQQRLREARREEPEPATTGTAASADVVAERRKGRGFFISAEDEALDRDVTTFADGYDSDTQRVTAGADFQITSRWVAGLAFDASEQDGHFEGGGDFEVKSLGIVGFGVFLPSDKTFVQFYAGFTSKSNDRNRVATFTDELGNVTAGRPDADFDADQFSAGILAGYDYRIGNVTIGPRAGLDWIDTDFDTHSETDVSGSGLALTFHNDEQTSRQSTVGVQASVALKTGFGVVVPQASFDWKHEAKNDQRTVEVSFVDDIRAKRFTYQTAEPDRDWFEINAGVTAVLHNGLQVFGNYRTLRSHRFFDSRAVTIGLRAAF